MESDLQKHFRPHPQPMMNPGLTRFRSAPSSFFATLLDSCEEFLDRPSSPETERMLTRLLSGGNIADSLDPPKLAPNEANSNSTCTAATATASSQQSQFTGYIKSEAEVLHNSSYVDAAPPQRFYHSSGHPPLPTRKVAPGGGGGGSSLIRQTSSPAGFFSSINVDSGSYAMRGFGGATNKVGEMLPPAARVFGSHTNLTTSRVDSSMAQMSVIAEITDTRIIGSEIQDHDFGTDFPIESWEVESTMNNMAENSRSLKRARDEDSKPFSDVQINEESRSRVPPILAHHLSLPRMSPDISEIDKFLHLQDSVPCKIRAKRGCATHPRSIAERVRRTKISERMRKLQELVPNMDRQTNTSDMLDLAVEYIKDLQEQVKMMNANRARCTCLYRHQL